MGNKDHLILASNINDLSPHFCPLWMAKWANIPQNVQNGQYPPPPQKKEQQLGG